MILDVAKLRAELTSLKLAAQHKRWAEAPKGAVEMDTYVFTCCVENNMLVLGVSGGPWAGVLTDEMYNVIVSVFGDPEVSWQAEYRNRGRTTLFQWSKR